VKTYTVKRQGARNFGIYDEAGELVEGGFFSRNVADSRAAEWDREARMTKTIPARDVMPGDSIWVEGFKYRVVNRMFDPNGNTGTQERWMFRVTCTDPRLPRGYWDITIGRLPNAPVTLAN
jgi:hypothetical protein